MIKFNKSIFKIDDTTDKYKHFLAFLIRKFYGNNFNGTFNRIDFINTGINKYGYKKKTIEQIFDKGIKNNFFILKSFIKRDKKYYVLKSNINKNTDSLIIGIEERLLNKIYFMSDFYTFCFVVISSFPDNKHFFSNFDDTKFNKIICNNKNISEIELEKIIYEDFIKGIIFSDFEKEIFEEIINHKLKQLGKIKENTNSRLKKRLKQLEEEKKSLISDYRTIQNKIIKESLEEDLEKTQIEIDKIKEELKNIPKNIAKKENHLIEYIYYINKLGTHFRVFPRIKKQKLIKAIFEIIIIENKNIIGYKLNPIFELAIKKNRVGTFNNNDIKSQSKCSNSNNSLSKSKTSNSFFSNLNGSPTRNRT